jgi:tRNA 2-thiouridine synthesizing protein A
MEFNKELDARGLKCPLPILRCKKGLAEINGGEVLKITATDPGSVKDFKAFCKQTGHELLLFEQVEEDFIFHIQKRIT